MKILNFVVAYKNLREVLEYAEELSRQECANEIGLVVVVNEAKDEEVERFKKEATEIDLEIIVYETRENLGYFNGFLYGVNRFAESFSMFPEWIVLSNTDILYRDKAFYNGFIQGKYSLDTYCVGPSIYKADTKTYQNPEALSRRPALKMKELAFIFSHKYLARLYIQLSNFKRSKPALEKPNGGFVYEIHGAFFAMRRNFVEYIMHKKYGALLYSEETYVAEELLRLGKKTYYDSEIEIIHNEHSVTGKLSIDNKARFLAESLKYIIKAYY